MGNIHVNRDRKNGLRVRIRYSKALTQAKLKKGNSLVILMHGYGDVYNNPIAMGRLASSENTYE
jgi:uncharacterized protein (AIM24 family)